MTLALGQIAIDCENAAALASFWSTLIDQPVDEGRATSSPPSGGAPGAANPWPVLMFICVPEKKGPKNRVHLDLHAARRLLRPRSSPWPPSVQHPGGSRVTAGRGRLSRGTARRWP